MKLKILLIILLSFTTQVYSQDKEANPLYFIWGSSQTERQIQIDSFPQDNFITGFQWNGTPKMNHALLNNAAASDGIYWETGTVYTSRRYLMNQPTYITSNGPRTGYGVGIWNAPAMVYEPTLYIPPDSAGKYIIRQHDPTNAIFGFQYYRGQILPENQYMDENYNRLNLRKDTDTGLVLNNIWPKPKFLTFVGGAQSGGYRGQKWNLTINLRRKNIAEDDTLDNKVVLEIKLPYRAIYQNNYSYHTIKFDSLPCTILNYSIPINYYDFRGYELKKDSLRGKDTILKIYRSMLPIDTNNKDITISSHFLTYFHGLNENNNPAFIGDTSLDAKIDSLDIEVNYKGVTDVCIDYIKIESDEAYYISRGVMDNLGILNYGTNNERPNSFKIFPSAVIKDTVNYFSIKDVLQSWITRYPKYNLNGTQTCPLFRFYAQEYESDNPVWWWQLRYYNLLTNGMAVTRDLNAYCPQYEYFTKAPNRYLGLKIHENEHFVAAPYIRHGWDSIPSRNMGLKYGFYGFPYIFNGNTPMYKDTLKSRYETYLGADDSHYFDIIHSDTTTLQTIENILLDAGENSFQSAWDLNSIIRYACPMDQSANKYLYSEKNWWYNLWPAGSAYIIDTTTYNFDSTARLKYFQFVNLRPKTGEELSLILSHAILMGCKGLLYDGECDVFRDYKNTYDSAVKVLPYDNFLGIGSGIYINNATGVTVESDSCGSDFVDSRYDNIWGIMPYLNLDSLSEQYMIEKNRIYIGLRSTRIQLKKIHTWIRANESQLMRLRLLAWYGKGFRQWQNQHPDSTTNLLGKFLLLDSAHLKVRPINRTQNYTGDDGLPFSRPYYEPYDSIFCDFSILRDISQSIESCIIVGVQNRRTDPLFYYTDSSSSPPLHYMKFLSTAEFDDSCKANPTKWDKWFWKRLGCREITIPFKYKNPLDTNEYCLLKIQEVGHDMDTTNGNNKWRKAKYHQTIDTIIGQDKDLVVRLLPGEGKLLKVQIIHPDKNISGYLAHSNQSKLIAYPIPKNDGQDSDSLRYHLVYFKKAFVKSTGDSGYAVFYVRSRPVQNGTDLANVVWDIPIPISLQYYQNCADVHNIISHVDCDHPSIVVRKDGISMKAYIVFACDMLATPSPIGNIVEAVIEFNEYDNIIPLKMPYAIGTFKGREIDSNKICREWGTPVINASNNGNFYAWSDSSRDEMKGGIVYGFKAPNIKCLDTFWISWNDPNLNIAKHPSLNTYSHIGMYDGEDNCALVWQEKCRPTFQGLNLLDSSTTVSQELQDKLSKDGIGPNPDDPCNFYSNIYYTRLRYRTGFNPPLFHYLPGNKMNYAKFFTQTVEVKNSIARLSEIDPLHYTDNTFPTVYRSIKSYNFNPTTDEIPNRIDKVFWQSRTDSIGQIGLKLKSRVVNLNDFSNNPHTWAVYREGSITSQAFALFQPNISQGMSNSINSNFDYERLYGDVLLDFTFGAQIGQLSLSMSSLIVDRKILYQSNFPSLVRQVTNVGNQPHLALSKDFKDTNKIWQNRRVYNVPGMPPKIVPSAKYFYRLSADDYITEPIVGFSSTITSCLINLPTVDNNPLTLNLPYDEVQDSVYGNTFIQTERDTIYSNWFNVSSSAILKFKCMNNTPILRDYMMIQRQDTAISLTLPLPAGPLNDTATLRIYTLINGNNHNYRLALINIDTTMFYSEHLYLEPVPVRDTMFFKLSAFDEQIIDLSNSSYESDGQNKIKIYLYPNPASNTVSVAGFLPLSLFKGDEAKYHTGKLILKLYTSLGGELMRKEIKSGETISIPLEDYQNGLYFIRADEKIEEYGVTPAQSGIQMFIREK